MINSEQLKQIQDFVQKYHAFGYYPTEEEKAEAKKLFPLIPEYGHSIKYIDTCYDTRFGDVWQITFRGMVTIHFSDRSREEFKKECGRYSNDFDMIMGFLKGEDFSKTIAFQENMRNKCIK